MVSKKKQKVVRLMEKCSSEAGAGGSVTSKLSAKTADTAARELEMVPKYLELASLNGTYRFTSTEINSITKHFEVFETELLRTDLLKELLAIGIEKGKPLTADELGGFLDATSSMTSKEQKNVLMFLKAAKENEGAKVTYQRLRENFPYEKFKEREYKKNEGTDWLKSHPEWLSEINLRERYQIALDDEYRIASNEYYNKGRAVLKNPPAQFATSGLNQEVTRAIAKCDDPVGFLDVIEKIGVGRDVLYSANELTKLLKLSDGNPALIRDLATLFYPEEIRQIAKALAADSKYNLSEHQGLTIRDFYDAAYTGPNYKYSRNKFIKMYNLEDKVKLSELHLRRYLDVYSGSLCGLGRGKLITDGNYEGGKKRK